MACSSRHTAGKNHRKRQTLNFMRGHEYLFVKKKNSFKETGRDVINQSYRRAIDAGCELKNTNTGTAVSTIPLP
jgi:hypothetical protein